jgi:hypothetical protein
MIHLALCFVERKSENVSVYEMGGEKRRRGGKIYCKMCDKQVLGGCGKKFSCKKSEKNTIF